MYRAATCIVFNVTTVLYAVNTLSIVNEVIGRPRQAMSQLSLCAVPAPIPRSYWTGLVNLLVVLCGSNVAKSLSVPTQGHHILYTTQ
jgi:hypothetical protein